jgi:hypothetical protein
MTFGSPYLDAEGNLALHGNVRLPDFMNGLQVCTVRTPDGQAQLRARVGDLAPVAQLPEDPVKIKSFSPYGCQVGNVFFSASLEQSKVVTSAAMVSTPAGLQIVARQGEQLPGMPGRFTSFSTTTSARSRRRSYFAVTGPGLSTSYIYRA